jgi:hypothetical protein
MTQLDDLLQAIDPARTFDQTSARVHEALSRLRIDSALIQDWNAYREFMASLYCRLEAAALGATRAREVNLEFDWDRCARLLNRVYKPAGYKAAFEMARTGNEGGLRAVMQALAEKVAETYAENEISARVGRFIENLVGVPERYQATVAEYLKKHGRLLPSEVTEGSGARVTFNFQAVLENHSKVLRRLRSTGR